MPVDRLYTPSPFEVGQVIALPKMEIRHLRKVLKAPTGKKIEVIDGKGSLGIAKLEADDTLSILSVEKSPPPKHRLILVQAFIRSNRLDTIIEKGTELGATDFWLFQGMHSERKTAGNFDRLQRVAISATKQCGRLFLPCIQFLPPLKEWGKEWKQLPQKAFFGSLKAKETLLSQIQSNSSTAFFVGPERGWAKEESQLLAEKEVMGVLLHTNTLRTDTAAIAALSILSH